MPLLEQRFGKANFSVCHLFEALVGPFLGRLPLEATGVELPDGILPRVTSLVHFQIDRDQLDDKVTVLFLLKQRLQMICSNECSSKVLQIVIGNRSRLWISDAQNSFGLDLALCASDVRVIGCSKALLVTFYILLLLP